MNPMLVSEIRQIFTTQHAKLACAYDHAFAMSGFYRGGGGNWTNLDSKGGEGEGDGSKR